ncbi:MAG: inorganic phosphate transporter [Cyanobacteriota bacterium]
MLTPELLPFLIAMFFAINMGASGIAPSFSCTYGANILSRTLIPGIFGSFVFIGAIIAGDNVIKTISKGIVSSELITFNCVIIILSACTVSLFIANILKIPQSTSQATVGALVGVGILYGNINIKTLLFMIPMWFVLPVLSFIITYLIAKFWIKINPDAPESMWNKLNDKVFLKYVVILTSCYVAFSIGSNNVANAAGPLVSAGLATPMLAVLIIAPCFGIGSSILGYRTLESTGKEITQITPLSASIISLVSGSLLLSASFLGVPQSLVQLNVASIFAVGCSKDGFKEMVKVYTIKKAIAIWIIAPILSLVLAYLLGVVFL